VKGLAVGILSDTSKERMVDRVTNTVIQRPF